MFFTPFSFQGRIRRTEFGISLLIYTFFYAVIVGTTSSSPNGMGGIALIFIPMLWFLWAQGAKRCHDLGKSGIWQIVPFYFFWMLFQDGQFFVNEYGSNPKGIDDNHDFLNQQGPFSEQHGDHHSGSISIDKRIDLTKK